jgi:hypothetical protein
MLHPNSKLVERCPLSTVVKCCLNHLNGVFQIGAFGPAVVPAIPKPNYGSEDSIFLASGKLRIAKAFSTRHGSFMGRSPAGTRSRGFGKKQVMATSVSQLAAKRVRVQGILPTSPARQGEFGTYFIGYARSPRTIEQMLQNMGLGLTRPRAIVCPAKGWRAALAIPSAAVWTLRPAGWSKIRKAGMGRRPGKDPR